MNTLVPFTDGAAGNAARRWAIVNYNLVGRTLAPSHVTRSDVRSTEVAYHVRFRQVVARTEPVTRKTTPEISFPTGSDLDPWADDIAEQLPPRRLVAECHDCEGNGQRTCPRCNGTVRVTCDACGGSGDEWSSRSGRTIRCGECKGKGQRACPCRDGLIPCTTCNAKGVVRAWLEVEEGTRDIVKKHADDGFAIEPGYDNPNVELALEWTGDPADRPDNVTSVLTQEALRYASDHHTERIERISIKQLRSEKATVRFEGAATHGDVEVQAWTGEVHRTGNSDWPFLAAKRRLRLAWVATFIASVVLLGWFTSRHRYYAESAAAGYLAFLALAFPIAVTWPVLRIQRAARSGIGILVACIPVVCVIGAQGVLAASGPSVRRAEELRAAGRLDEARYELKAAAETTTNPERARNLHDQVQLQSLDSNHNPTRIWSSIVDAYFFDQAVRDQAEARALMRVSDAVGALQEDDDYRQSRLILAAIPSRLQSAPSIRGRFVAADRHDAETAWAIIRSKKPLSERLAACTAIGPPLAALQKTSESISAPAPVVDQTCAAVRAEEQRRVRAADQQARAAQLEQNRQAQLARQREEAAARALAMAPLQCRDGSLSRTCVCGGSHRGCCSGHGGVAGCSK